MIEYKKLYMENRLTQDAAIKLVESIGETLGLERIDDALGVSYYAISEQSVVRLSDHSTHLQTWVDKGTYTKRTSIPSSSR